MSQNDYKVIVVEDEVMILKNIVQKIDNSNLGFKVIFQAINGKKAIEFIEENIPDVIFTDIRMPQMDGIELIKELDEKYINIKKVVISGYSEFEYAQSAIKYNVSDYLIKPVKIDELNKTLMKLKIILDTEREQYQSSFGTNMIQLTPIEVAHYIKNYVKENYKENIDFNILISKFNYTQSYINSLFIKLFKESPTKYQTTLRINEAKKLLLDYENLTIKQISLSVGYEDQSYFSRIFKKITLKSPQDYRN